MLDKDRREKLADINFKPDIKNNNIYLRIVNDCKSFKQKIKTIRFAGNGELLVNKHLA